MPVFRFDFELHASQEAITRRGEVMRVVADAQEKISPAAAIDVFEQVIRGQDQLLNVPALLSHVDAPEPRTILAGTIAVCETVTDTEPMRFAGVWTMNDDDWSLQLAELMLREHRNAPEPGIMADLHSPSAVLGQAVAENQFLIQTAIVGVPVGVDPMDHPDAFLLPYADTYRTGRPYTVSGLEAYFATSGLNLT